MCKTTDGFVISEEDLKMRGPGDMDGTQQSGTPMQLRIADLARDGQILMAARNAASDLLSIDPQLADPKHFMIKTRQNKIFSKEQNWSRIS